MKAVQGQRITRLERELQDVQAELSASRLECSEQRVAFRAHEDAVVAVLQDTLEDVRLDYAERDASWQSAVQELRRINQELEQQLQAAERNSAEQITVSYATLLSFTFTHLLIYVQVLQESKVNTSLAVCTLLVQASSQSISMRSKAN